MAETETKEGAKTTEKATTTVHKNPKDVLSALLPAAHKAKEAYDRKMAKEKGEPVQETKPSETPAEETPATEVPEGTPKPEGGEKPAEEGKETKPKEETPPENPYRKRLEKMRESGEAKENAQIKALESKVDKLTEMLAKQGESSSTEETDKPFSFREITEDEDIADYQKAKEEALANHVRKQAEKKAKSADTKPDNTPAVDDGEVERQLAVLRTAFDDPDDLEDAIESKRLTVQMIPHINSTANPEAVTMAIANDGKFARRLRRLSLEELSLEIRALDHDITNGVKPGEKAKETKGTKETKPKEDPKNTDSKGIPETRPSATKGEPETTSVNAAIIRMGRAGTVGRGSKIIKLG